MAGLVPAIHVFTVGWAKSPNDAPPLCKYVLAILPTRGIIRATTRNRRPDPAPA
jgi:hypothetical protein